MPKVLGELTEAPTRIRQWIDRTAPVMAELLDISYFHYAVDPDTGAFTHDTPALAVAAAQHAFASIDLTPGDMDLLCYGSPHMDQMPTPSAQIQERLGIPFCDELAVHANCTSAYKALYLAHHLIADGTNERALVLSANMASAELKADYYNQKKLDKESLFLRWFLCDGAGAVILTSRPEESSGYRLDHTYIESLAGSKPSLMGNRRPGYWINPRDEYDQAAHHLRQSFRNELSSDIFQEAEGSVFIKGLRRMMAKTPCDCSRIRWFQVNLPAKHIAESVREECKKEGIPRHAFYSRMEEMGYAGPPMAFICLDRLLREERCAPGEQIASFVTEVSKFMQAGYLLTYAP